MRLLILVLTICFSASLLAQVGIRVVPTVQFGAKSSTTEKSDYESRDIIQESYEDADTTSIYGYRILNAQTFRYEYTSGGAAGLHVYFDFDVTKRFALTTGIGVRWERLLVRESFNQTSVRLSDVVETFEYTPFRPTPVDTTQIICDPNSAGYGYGTPFPFQSYHLEIPLSVRYTVIPGWMWVNAGAYVNAPFLSTYPDQRAEFRGIETDDFSGIQFCRFESVAFTNRSGHMARSFGYGYSFSVEGALSKRVNLRLGYNLQQTNYFVDGEYQNVLPALNFTDKSHRNSRVEFGIAWKVFGAANKGLDL